MSASGFHYYFDASTALAVVLICFGTLYVALFGWNLSHYVARFVRVLLGGRHR